VSQQRHTESGGGRGRGGEGELDILCGRFAEWRRTFSLSLSLSLSLSIYLSIYLLSCTAPSKRKETAPSLPAEGWDLRPYVRGIQ